MSNLYDNVEPAVIDEDILKKCIEEQGPKGEAGKIAKRDEICFKDIKELRLDFKNILKMDNLWRFTGLIKLQLDNNVIEKIQGLEALINLKWLDLSFNNIESIDGLSTLTNLCDLSLFNNRISSIGNMENLKELQVLSLGNNSLKKLEEVIYLRSFKKLNTLNLHGNPFCKEENYYKYTLAHLPALVYFDYRLVDNEKREEAIELYRDSIDELIHNENVLIEKKMKEEDEIKEKMLQKEAYVDDVNGSALFDNMFEEDVEAPRLLQLPGVDELIETYKNDFVEVCKKLFDLGLDGLAKRKEEMKQFFAAIYKGVDDNLNKCVQHIEKFDAQKFEVFKEMMAMTDYGQIESKLSVLSNQVSDLWDVLMSFEMQLVDQLEDSIKDFERHMLDMVGNFVEQMQDHVSQLRDLENNHHEKLSDIAVVTLEKLMKNELEEDLSDDVRMLFVDRDTVMNAVSASHDTHLFRIDNKEDDIITRVNSDVHSTIEMIHAQEIKRNRTRVTEINNLMDRYRDEIENFESNLNS